MPIVLVEHQRKAGSIAGPSRMYTLTNTPVSGDALVLVASHFNSTPSVVDSVSGCGATWTRASADDFAIQVWVGHSPDGSGNTVTVTNSTTLRGSESLYLFRGSLGRVGGTLSAQVDATDALGVVGPSQAAGLGQIVVAGWASPGDDGSAEWGPLTPSGWVTEDVAEYIFAQSSEAYRIPGSTALHSGSVEFSAIKANVSYYAQVVIGPLRTPGLPPLRKIQRSDGLGASSARAHVQRDSQQASLRRGRAYY